MAVNPQTVTRRRATTTTDRYGATVLDWATPNELAIDGCAIAPNVAPESNEYGRLGVPVGWTLYRRSPADIGPLDRVVTADGRVFEVDGEPAEWSSPFTTFAGVAVALRLMEG